MKFLRDILASCIGASLAFMGVMSLFFLMTIGVIVELVEDQEQVQPVSTQLQDQYFLYLHFRTPIEERTKEDVDVTGLGKIKVVKHLGLYDLTSRIRRAATDSRVAGIYLDLRDAILTLQQADAIKAALQIFRESGKPIIAYSDIWHNTSFYLANGVADCYLPEGGTVVLTGLKLGGIYIGRLLEKLGVQVQIFRIGKYKSAGEMFVRENMSPESREVLSQIVSEWHQQWLTGITPEGKGSSWTDSLLEVRPVFYSHQAQVLGLKVVSDESAVLSQIAEQVGADSLQPETFLLPIQKYPGDYIWTNDAEIAVLYALGPIVRGKGDPEKEILWRSFYKYFRQLLDDDQVAAIVLRVNSPGGDAIVSEEIWQLIRRSPKPVVVSMGSVAASGGYYISSPAKIIFAEPFTITGSIGVIGLYPYARPLLYDKLGINYDVVKSTPWADIGNPWRPLTEQEQQYAREAMREVYQMFIQRVAQARQLPVDSVDYLGQGRIYSAYQAQQVGLVDSIGYLEDAIEAAARLAGVEFYSVRLVPPRKNLLERLIEESQSEIAIEGQTRYVLQHLNVEPNDLISWFKTSGIQLRLPYLLWQQRR